MRKYLGIVSISILIVTVVILQLLVGKQIGHLWMWIMSVGYIGAALSSWYSEPGFWRKASAVIVVVLPVGFLVFIVLFIVWVNGVGVLNLSMIGRKKPSGVHGHLMVLKEVNT
jgi:hypothetical protein